MKKNITGKEYEKVVSQIVKTLFEIVGKERNFEVKSGGINKWSGISGFQHQIDVSIETNDFILLVECKEWSSSVDVPSFLTFLARVIDIKSKYSNKPVYGKMVSTRSFQSGVHVLASYYKIDLDKVKNEQEFLLKFQKYGLASLVDNALGLDSFRIKRQCSACGSILAACADKTSYACPNCFSYKQ